MPTNEKKGITVKIDAELHAEVRQYLESHEMTMAEFVTIALQDELHPIAIHKNILTLDNGGKIEIGDDENAKYRSTRIDGKGI